MSEAAAYRGAPPSTRLLADVGMGVCLMIERQEDVTWQQWLALAEVCERGGFEGLFRSDHYLSVFGHEQRGVA
jgi:alkanesulfonate monooxygenase SsuD/methylene tetrahydromethanopterin reductase-like flavin-dependent oxidoreductase (luciferase family)